MRASSLQSAINWPAADGSSSYKPSGLAGHMVYAVWDIVDAPTTLNYVLLDTSERLISAEGPATQDILLHQDRAQRGVFDGLGMWNYLTNTAVLIGSSRGSFYSEEAGRYFGVTRSDLTERGEAMISALEEFYGDEATFLTFLDDQDQGYLD